MRGTGLKALTSLNSQVSIETWLEMRTGLPHNTPCTICILQDVPRLRRGRKMAAGSYSIVAGKEIYFFLSM